MPFDAFSPDLGGEHRTKSIPPETDRFMADIDAALVQKIFDIPEREWKPHVHHHGEADDLWAGSEVPKWVGLGHKRRLIRRPAHLKSHRSDKTRARS